MTLTPPPGGHDRIRAQAGGLPPYTSKVMSDADVWDIRVYLATIPVPPPLKNIPLLNQ